LFVATLPKPLKVHELAPEEDQVKVEALPLETVVGLEDRFTVGGFETVTVVLHATVVLLVPLVIVTEPVFAPEEL